MVVQELRDRYSLHLLLDIAGLKKSTFFYALVDHDYKKNKDQELGDLIVRIFNDNHKKYGRPRIVQELKRMGFVINNKKVYRIMKDRGLTATPRKRKYSSYKGKIGKICRNHLLKKRLNKTKRIYIYERHFETDRPYQILGTDVTQFQIETRD